jgi:uncharacterized membrane protein
MLGAGLEHMVQWYAKTRGRDIGPVSEWTLREWCRLGRLSAGDLVWSEESPQPLPASEALPGLTRDLQSASVVSLVACPRTRGTGGASPNGDLVALAREALDGKWLRAGGFFLLLVLLSIALGGIPTVGPLVSLLFLGPLYLGAAAFFLALARGGEAKLEMLTAGFAAFGRATGVYLLVAFVVIVLSILLVVPGLVAALSLSQVMFVLADDPRLTPGEALRRSRALMAGRKTKLLRLWLRLLGWGLLCLLTLGIGWFWWAPYAATSLASFYDDLHPADGAESDEA